VAAAGRRPPVAPLVGIVLDAAGGASSGGQTDAAGGGVDAAADAAETGGAGSGGIGGTAGTGGGGVDAAAGAAGTGGNVCNGQCPLIATIGITGVWDYTYSNGTSGDVVTTGNNLFLAWLATRSANCTVENLDISGSNSLTAARLARYKVIVVLDTLPYAGGQGCLPRHEEDQPRISYLSWQATGDPGQ